MDMYAAIAEPTRRSILELLAVNGQLPASQIYDYFPVSAPAISQHLKVLKEAKLVNVEKKAQQRLYAINPKPMQELDEWLHKITKHYEERYDRLEVLLEREKRKEVK